MANTIIPVGNSVKGDVTSCKLEDIVIKVDKNSALSIFQNETHKVYDVCTKQVANTYIKPDFTELGNAAGVFGSMGAVILSFIVLLFLVSIVAAIWNTVFDK